MDKLRKYTLRLLNVVHMFFFSIMALVMIFIEQWSIGDMFLFLLLAAIADKLTRLLHKPQKDPVVLNVHVEHMQSHSPKEFLNRLEEELSNINAEMKEKRNLLR
ncbi:hypothetical protein A616_16495 [Brevibacillus brevis X23]|nr:hypothetical protein A616_16495 [Brevibacillus brevis X23]